MNARLYLILSLLLLSVQYSRSQFLDYIPLEHKNNSYEDVTKEAREFEEYVRRRELELERKLEYDRRAEITRRAYRVKYFTRERSNSKNNPENL